MKDMANDLDHGHLISQLVTKPIPHKQLLMEVKMIHAELVMVEKKCIDVDQRLLAATQEKESDERGRVDSDQWRSLLALHMQVTQPPEISKSSIS